MALTYYERAYLEINRIIIQHNIIIKLKTIDKKEIDKLNYQTEEKITNEPYNKEKHSNEALNDLIRIVNNVINKQEKIIESNISDKERRLLIKAIERLERFYKKYLSYSLQCN